MQNDNANPEVIDITNLTVKDCVRLYFRPLTPTQYHNEGYHDSNEANVSVPIFLTFKSIELLSLPNVKFSEKGLNKKYNSGTPITSLEKFALFNFNEIYSYGVYDSNIYPERKNYRHAEVLFENELSLEFLENIWCRTNAEMETLKYGLREAGILNKYNTLIGVKENNAHMFNKHKSFINFVLFTDKKLYIDCTIYEPLVLTAILKYAKIEKKLPNRL